MRCLMHLLVCVASVGELQHGSMKAIGLRHSTGGTDLLEEFECDLPTLQPTDLLVRVVACAMNPVDCKLRTNRGRPGPLSWPLILGFDGAGVVEATGTNATRFHVGDKVYFVGAIGRNGTNAEFVAVDERLVATMPKSISFTEAAALPLVSLTAWESLFESAGFETVGRFGQHFATKGKHLLVLPGAGGVGGMAIQLAKSLTELHVVGTASRPQSVEVCRKLGADLVVNHSEPLQPQLRSAGLGVDSIDYILNGYDISTRFLEYVEVLKPFGRIIDIVPAERNLPMYKMMPKRLSYVWEWMFARAVHGTEVEKQGIILDLLSDFVDQGKVRAHVSDVLPWSLEAFRTAHQRQESEKMVGKIVITREEEQCKPPDT